MGRKMGLFITAVLLGTTTYFAESTADARRKAKSEKEGVKPEKEEEKKKNE